MGRKGGITLVHIMRLSVLTELTGMGEAAPCNSPSPPFNFLFESKTKVLLIDNLSYRQYKSVEFMFVKVENDRDYAI